ncbi:MAG: L-lactate dehydrogenase [Candidatus Buchananbacteria bacterium RIFCSPHIGHO2_02_FULL_40_13]|uniref:L-lactate dehydrogenase n=1 Tax=Candidatus Buchananbacteria bacterium RIFCSPLOWO2_01_FULL_39_33 TaxID=1797543 RepID=A0A1G1YH43_9BACT|nr:MAG: L-lactate dehydrogenase [Candidatus Buchananbacteria bacterium RIFCSPHIGHO2_01_FULL_40_35]OGY49634.1 MAG: L-lactate dehydrogenase [Candidatus Buchananbacteria bacterium RIFCSPHIGHO2_02_FULL_40_13]OGY51675.1 MAG: L-lactate dehydrogenase [Candidatus Buchananbacteria bacterium RIFCSPLOWO2_01_FULL_39_33]
MSINNKVTIIGAGLVGSTTAFSLLAENVAEEIALIDINKKLVSSQVMDLQHSVPFLGYAKVKVGTYNDIGDSRLVIITSGASQKPGETRLDLIKKNSTIIKEIVPQIFKANPKVIVIMVTNPVDILTHLTIKMFPDKKNQIIGSGTVLDSARLRFLLGERLKVDPKSIHAYIVGEHGDSEVPLWSTASIGNAPLDKFKKLTAAEKNKIFKKAKNAAYAIIAGKQATYYAIAAGVAQIAKAILFDQKTVLSVSHLIEGEYGLRHICLSLPVVIGRTGIIGKLPLAISKEEKKQLQTSAAKLKEAYKTLRAS